MARFALFVEKDVDLPLESTGLVYIEHELQAYFLQSQNVISAFMQVVFCVPPVRYRYAAFAVHSY